MLNSRKIGAYISEQRKNKNLTQAELAEKLNITHQAISKWEKGSSLPDIAILVELAEIFEITVDEILKGENNEVERKHIGNSNPINEKSDRGILDEIMESVENIKNSFQKQSIRKTKLDLDFEESFMKQKESFKKQKESFMKDKERLKDDIKSKFGKLNFINSKDLVEIAPFLDRKSTEKGMDIVTDGMDLNNIISLAPFLGKDKIDSIVDYAINKEELDLNILMGLCPFISREKIDELVDNMLDDEGVEKVFKGVAPFLSSDKCEEIFYEMLDKDERNYGVIANLAPFLNNDVIVEAINIDIKSGKSDGKLLSILRHFIS